MVFLLGGSGYIGQAFQRFFSKNGIPFRSVSRKDCDYSRIENLHALLAEAKPLFLINAAGYTGKPNVDACEFHKTECLFGNAIFPSLVAQACQDANVPWGHVSSGCIFSGSRADGSGFTEEDSPNFCFRTNNGSFYSGTKALGEEILGYGKGLAPLFPKTYVWRLRIPFNEIDNPRNYLTKLMHYERLLNARNSLSQLDEFARACWECWEKRIPFGLYHVTNPGSITTEEIVALIRKKGPTKKEFHFFKDDAEFMALAVKTPRSNCILDSTKLARQGITMTDVHAALEQALRQWKGSGS
jgi:dTDP-4-dehydrorhamnose reductase